MNIFVTGSNGQLGNEIYIKRFSNDNFIFLAKEKFDITNIEQIYNFSNSTKPDIIINTAAYTNTTKSENNKSLAYAINVNGVMNLINLCKKFNTKLIHISTDYIFDGKKQKPYSEFDLENPINYYGKTKLLAEKLIIDQYIKNTIILRTSMLYSNNKKNIFSNIVDQLMYKNKLEYVDDIICSPTSAIKLAEACIKICETKFINGIYNFSDNGFCSRFEFADFIQKCLSEYNNKIINNKILKINSKNFNSTVKRPTYTVLDCNKFSEKYDFTFYHWKDNVSDLIKNIYKK